MTPENVSAASASVLCPTSVMAARPAAVRGGDSSSSSSKVLAPSPIKNILGAKLASSNLSPYIKLVSGMAGGVAEACTLQPLDVAKTRLQLDKTNEYNGMIDCLKKTARNEGVGALYKGLTPFVTHLTLKYALRFGAFEKFKVMLGADAKGNASAKVNFTAGLAVGTLEACMIVTPFEVIKTRLQKQKVVAGQEPMYRGPIDVVVKIVRNEGIQRLWSGNMPTVIRQGSNQAFNFMSMAILNKMLWGKEQGDGKVLAVWQTLLNGLLAGAVGPCLNAPIDVVKTRMMGQDFSKPGEIKYTGWYQTARLIAAEEGLPALWKGIIPRLSRLAPGQAITWTVVMRVSTYFENLQKEIAADEKFKKEAEDKK
ncbi:Mitochondrial succinate-fumarate transporter 1 [Hondaea fermentalgiana]|uniref:Mitochondrial succinate-fumarate transporter 1 n=1 Tax=Hondaea fermentalgiana TaxID=2315210 RepID=A0A2R5G1X8_9STRA|nr:Mitochondrial succinate-fumarate transporter 1 [Hondaea fermentalgiana]|eukprot:GBG25010.1 Mitochondrial succinate-fumarate transporter 1 [Hondaea fermentalgiana]